MFVSAYSAGNSLVFGEYILKAANQDPGQWTLRFVGLGCITFAWLLHGTTLKWGLRLQNALGMFKLIVLLIVIGTGFMALSGNMKVEKPNNFENMFEGTIMNTSSFCLSLYSVRLYLSGVGLTIILTCQFRSRGRTWGLAMPITHCRR